MSYDAERHRAWKRANPEKVKQYERNYRLRKAAKVYETERRNLLRRKYNMTLEQYEELSRAQAGVCALCGTPPPAGRALDVDHCHNSGRVRGLLCNRCNTAIGRLGDSLESLQKVVDYLQRAS